MESHITSKGEREQRLLRLKENKIYNKEREKCAADYPAGKLGGAEGL